MLKDRNYFRMCDDASLIRMGRDSMHELAIVLADRLSDLSDTVEALEEDFKDMSIRCDDMRDELAATHNVQ
jgi:hypothetical protein